MTSRESTLFLPLRTQRRQSSICNIIFNIFFFLQNIIADKINKELESFKIKRQRLSDCIKNLFLFKHT